MTAHSNAQQLRQPQLGIWFSQLVRPEDDSYVTLEVLEIRGPLSKFRLKDAWGRLMQSLPHLNVRIETHRESLVQIPEDAQPELEDYPLGNADGLSTLEDWAASEPGPVLSWKLVRAALVTEGPEHHWLGLRIHHVLIDGFGYELLFRQWGRLYDAPATPSPFIDNCQAALLREESAYQSSPDWERDGQTLSRLCTVRPDRCPFDEAPPPAARPRTVASILTPGGLAPLKAAAKQAGIEWLALLIAAVSRGLGTRFSRPQLTVGLLVASRMGSVGAATPSMVMNLVPLLVEQGRESGADALASQLKLIRRAQRFRHEELRRRLRRRPFEALFEFALNLQFQGPQVGFSGLSVRRHSVWKGPVENLMVSLTETPQGAELRLEGHPELYSDSELALLLHRCVEHVTHADRPPKAVRLESPAPESQTHISSPATMGTLTPSAPTPSLFDTWLAFVAADAGAPCIEDGAITWSRGDLLQAVQSWAVVLQARGVAEGSFVAIDLPRSAEFIAVELAALWLGAAFVPLDSEGPIRRKELICAQLTQAVRVTDVLVREKDRVLRAGEFTGTIEPVREGPRATAYVIFTSGTSGTPRGVMVERGNLDHFAHVAAALYGFAEDDRVLQFASLGFDASVEEVFCTLVRGATLVLRREHWLDSSASFWALVAEHAITVLDLPTALFHTLAEDLKGPFGATSLKTLIVGGEALLGPQLQRFQAAAPAVALWNTYGPTETTVVCLAWRAPQHAAPTDPPLGRPLPGVMVTVAPDDPAHPDTGELIVWGPTVARGYLGDASSTAARFMEGAPTQTGHSERGYRTGDRVTLRADGEIAYLGRVDSELKISGYRVQPLELERTLATLPCVSEAVVLADPEAARLLAFVRADGSNEKELRRALADRYPRPLIPSLFLQPGALPRDGHGKVDRRALLAVAQSQKEGRRAADALGLPTHLQRVVTEVLGNMPLDAHFFDAGGTSLLALRLHAQLTREFGAGAPLGQLFRAETTAEFLKSWGAKPTPGTARTTAMASPFVGDLIQLDSRESGAALVCLPSADGLASSYWAIPEAFPEHRTYSFNAIHDDGAKPDSYFATEYAKRIGSSIVDRQVTLLGWSSGGGLAFTVARELQENGYAIREILLLDALAPECFATFPEPTLETALVMLLDGADASPQRADGTPKTVEELLNELRRAESSMAQYSSETLLEMATSIQHGMRRYRRLVIPRSDAPVTLYRSTLAPPEQPNDNGWNGRAGQMRVIPFPFHHLQMCSREAILELRRLHANDSTSSGHAQNSRSIW